MAQPAPQSPQSDSQSDSMEDILQSIKRIIEDDSGVEKPAALLTPVDTAEDVLDLTQMVKEDGSLASVAPLRKTTSQLEHPPVQDVVESIDAMLAPAPVTPPAAKLPEPPAPPPAEAPPKPAAVPAAVRQPLAKEDGLVSDQATQAAVAALRPIVENAQKDYSIPKIASPELRTGNTVEDLLLEALRPMLKAWLDEHLPTIVQKIVEKEVKRIVAFHQD